MKNNTELLPLTNDYIFKRVFSYKGNESVLKDFLEAVLKTEIKTIKIENSEIIPKETNEKRGLLDIKAQINDGTILDVEMQMKNERNTEERATEYMGKMLSEQLQVGEAYQKLKKSIVIFITNYNFLKRNSYHSVGRMKFDETPKEEYVEMGYQKEDDIASKYMEFHYIELPKFKKRELSKFTKLDQWLCVFTQDKEGIMLAEKKNKEIKKAMNTLDFLSKDPKERERHNSIVMAEYNRLVSEQNFFEDGVKKGKIGIAKKLLKLKMPIEQIQEITQLTKEEIEKLK